MQTSQLSIMNTQKAFFYIFAAISIFGCSNEKSESKITPQEITQDSHLLKGAVVDTSVLFKNPENYEGKSIIFYAKRVYAKPDADLTIEGKDGRFITSADDRIPKEPPLSIIVPPGTKDKWLKAGFLPNTTYTITFSGTIRRVNIPGLKKDHHFFEVRDFYVNSQDIYQYTAVQAIENNLPAASLPTPLPEIESDLKKISLFPENYAQKTVRINIIFRRDQVQNETSDYARIETDELAFMIPKKLMSQAYESISDVNMAWLIGKTEKNRDPSKKTALIVTNIYLKNKNN